MPRTAENPSSASSPRKSLAQSLASGAFVFLTLAVMALMLLVNAVLCLSIFNTVRTHVPGPFVDHPNVANPVSQLYFFIGPILLTVIQWHLLDRFNRSFRN